jgi:DNA-directed RNA polymerase specialized sigma24 family protein
MGFMSHVACQKIMDVMRKQMTQKRDSSREISLHEKTDIFRPMDPKSHEPTPSQYAMAEEVRQALTHESDEVDSDSALIMKLKSQNYTNHEISQSTGIHLRKVQRLLKNIKHRFFQSKS